MLPTICLIPCAVGELLANATATRQISLADRYGLMAAVLDENLPMEERRAIDRLLRAIRRGRIQLVDEVSSVLG